MLESLDLPFVQRGLAEIALLSVGAGLIGTWIVLRGLAFFSHAVGTAAFPGLVIADGLGFAAPLGALGAALMFAAVLALVARHRPSDRGAETALVLVGMLALGVILASDVFGSSSAIATLLFGSLLLIDTGDLALAAGVSAVAVIAAFTLGRHWVAAGFDDRGDASARRTGFEAVLLVLIALATAAALGVIGALLVAALFVIPAATTRLWCSRMVSWQLATIALCAATGATGVLLSVEINTPPGATIAVLSGALFALSAIAAQLRRSLQTGGAGLRWIGATLAALSLIALGGCGSDDDADERISVVATTPLVADLAGNVAGSEARVSALLTANVDPHEYEPRPDDIRALADADLVIASGGDLDAWIADALADSGSDAELVVAADAIPHPVTAEHSEEEDEHADEDGDHADSVEPDPHWWHDPRNAAAVVGRIAESLAAHAPDIAAAIEKRGSAYAREIEGLDRGIAQCLAFIPASQRKIVTDHDAFSYLAERYDIEIVGAVIPALTTEAQASAGELAQLRETIEREGVRAVFPESSVSGDLARTIAEETGASAEDELYGDTLGPAGSPGHTYLGMIAANTEALMRGMSGGARGCISAEGP